MRTLVTVVLVLSTASPSLAQDGPLSVHESGVQEASLGAGRHQIRVEYFQGGGWAELRAEVIRQ